MRRTSAELKRLSREQLNGHWGFAIGANLLLQLIFSAVLMPFYFLFLFSGQGIFQFAAYVVGLVFIGAVSMVIQCGIIRIYFCFARKQQPSIGMMFKEFTRRPDRYVIGYFLLFGIGLLCLLPGVVCWVVGLTSGLLLPSVIGVFLYLAGLALMLAVAFRYALVFYLMVDHEDMGVLEAFHHSTELMEGNKGRLFYIYLSFLGWSVLGMLSCGLGMLWIMPYMTQVSVNFYREVIGELDQRPDVGNVLNDMPQ